MNSPRYTPPMSKAVVEWFLNEYAVRTRNGVRGKEPNRKLRRAAKSKR